MQPDEPIYCSTFCNFAHRLKDGKPIGHECYVIAPKLLAKERNGETWTNEEYEAWRKSRRIHRGLKPAA